MSSVHRDHDNFNVIRNYYTWQLNVDTYRYVNLFNYNFVSHNLNSESSSFENQIYKYLKTLSHFILMSSIYRIIKFWNCMLQSILNYNLLRVLFCSKNDKEEKIRTNVCTVLVLKSFSGDVRWIDSAEKKKKIMKIKRVGSKRREGKRMEQYVQRGRIVGNVREVCTTCLGRQRGRTIDICSIAHWKP